MELLLFPHIEEIGVIKNSAIRLNGFLNIVDDGLKIYYVQEGKFEWTINHRPFILYPGDVALILPGIAFGNENNVLEVGSFSWIHLRIKVNKKGQLLTGSWSSLSDSETRAVSKILQMNSSPVLQKFTEAGHIFKSIQSELFNQEIGYQARVNHLLDEIFIQMSRQFSRISNPGRDFPSTFMKLEHELRQDLSHQWTVEEMAALVGLGTTLFNDTVKSYSGFSPVSYLINIRISEAIKLLKKSDINLTDIALDTGFYSSQHFSTTFKKLTGYTPSQFRKNHSRTK
ncbi:AraC family transcriptional regulator [Ginsengibacter hankyongi]|uniref:AraC family transcriptional regulator n=1 Tax=Ginsengibacter hankyongi TaxID=2607284 RepID=UPI001F45ED21|nr:AraC family transcriptional regulator [Ginsengibacter hankyongi]